MSGSQALSAAPLSARERAPFYAVASRLLLAEIDAAAYQLVASTPLRAWVAGDDTNHGAWLDEGWSDGREAALREEYARLFLLPDGTPPFASAWLEGEREALGAQMHGFVTAALEALGREIRVAEPWGRIPLDHVGLLLDLVVVACAEESERGDEIAEHICREALGAWVAGFGTAVAARAQQPVYVGLGRLLRDLHARARTP